MPYTLAKWALWLVSAAVAGFVVGWMLRGLRRGTEGSFGFEGGEEVRDVRARAAALMSERNQLLAQLTECREQVQAERRAAAAQALQSTDAFDASQVEPIGSSVRAVAESSDTAERARLAQLVAEQTASISDLRVRLWNHEARIGELQDALAAEYAANAPAEPDLVAGSVVMGERVRFNDLTVVEGIGPKIADLLLNSGVKTWWQLHHADPDHLRRFLAEAGPQFQVHDPSTWPEQAGMLARGEWQQFKLLADRLKGARLAE